MTKGEFKQIYQDYPSVIFHVGLSLSDNSHDNEELVFDENEIRQMIDAIQLQELMSLGETDFVFSDEEEQYVFNDPEADEDFYILSEEGY